MRHNIEKKNAHQKTIPMKGEEKSIECNGDESKMKNSALDAIVAERVIMKSAFNAIGTERVNGYSALNAIGTKKRCN